MTALPLIAMLSIALGFMLGKEHGFKRGVKSCIALAKIDRLSECSDQLMIAEETNPATIQ